jgi:TonB family protein
MSKNTTLLFLILSLLPFVLNAQQSIESIQKFKEDTIARLDIAPNEMTLILPMSYASSNWQKIKQYKDQKIQKVELIYTAYHAPSYDQFALNQRRLKGLKDIYPACFQSGIEWQLIAQKGCNSKEECADYFHGFIIHYQTEPKVEEEIAYLDEVLKDLNFTKATAKTDGFYRIGELDQSPSFIGGQVEERRYFNRNLKYPETAKEKAKQGTVLILMSVNEEGEVIDAELMRGFDGECDQEALRLIKEMPKLNPGVIGEEFVNAKVKITVPFELTPKAPKTDYIYYDTYWEEEKRPINGRPKDPPFSTGGMIVENDLFIKIFQRNYSWDSLAVIVDLTGSMSPFTAQLMMWLYEDIMFKSHRVRHLTFFNDGDGKEDKLKLLGKAGGIYHLDAANFSELKATVKKVMRAGRGGDLPENNVEASLAAMQSCQNCGTYVLISDNQASPRDLALAEKLNKPLRIIICGATGGVNPAYLDLAYQSKGSIHTADDDINAIWELEVGDEMIFAGRKYLLKENGFELINNEKEH